MNGYGRSNQEIIEDIKKDISVELLYSNENIKNQITFSAFMELFCVERFSNTSRHQKNQLCTAWYIIFLANIPIEHMPERS